MTPPTGSRSSRPDRRPRPSRAAAAEEPLVYGRNPVRELLRAGRRGVRGVRALPELCGEDWLRQAGARPADRAALSKLAGSPDHQGVVALCDPYPYADAADVLDAPGPVIVLDGVQDVHNLGAVARTAEALGAAGLVIPSRGSPGVTPTVCKTSAGAVEHLLIARIGSLVAFVHDARGPRRAIGADAAGRDLREAGLDGDVVLVVGAEGEGLRPRVAAVCDELVAIPLGGSVASLNLSVACGILLAACALELRGPAR